MSLLISPIYFCTLDFFSNMKKSHFMDEKHLLNTFEFFIFIFLRVALFSLLFFLNENLVKFDCECFEFLFELLILFDECSLVWDDRIGFLYLWSGDICDFFLFINDDNLSVSLKRMQIWAKFLPNECSFTHFVSSSTI